MTPLPNFDISREDDYVPISIKSWITDEADISDLYDLIFLAEKQIKYLQN